MQNLSLQIMIFRPCQWRLRAKSPVTFDETGLEKVLAFICPKNAPQPAKFERHGALKGMIVVVTQVHHEHLPDNEQSKPSSMVSVLVPFGPHATRVNQKTLWHSGTPEHGVIDQHHMNVRRHTGLL